MHRISSFPPVENSSATALILGSMPGRESLRAGQYYAHPRNAFWAIMGKLTGAVPALPYDRRLEKMKASGFALWDVLASCTRRGSLDVDIDISSIRVNDFGTFLQMHSGITHIYFNGAMAEQSFHKYALPALAAQFEERNLTLLRLPSTSPANATYTFERKLEAWRTILHRNDTL